VCVAFQILGSNAKTPPDWHKASGHIIFDVKMDFTRKAHWVKDGHKTPNSTTSIFAGVLSRDSIRIALTHAALLGLPVICDRSRGSGGSFPPPFFIFAGNSKFRRAKKEGKKRRTTD